MPGNRFKDISNQRFNRLIALFPLKERKFNKVVWHCLCDCGNEVNILGVDLRKGDTQSCGCLQKERTSKAHTQDLKGQKFGRLTVLEKSRHSSSYYGVVWKCKCDCGNIKDVLSTSLKRGNVKSCGCLKSAGEQKIKKLLLKHNVNFSQEHSFLNLKGEGGGLLRFDFAIWTEKGELSHLIEFDGEQHFRRPSGKWGDNFKKIQLHDSLKNKYCEENNLRLIRIKYNERFGIGDLL